MQILSASGLPKICNNVITWIAVFMVYVVGAPSVVILKNNAMKKIIGLKDCYLVVADAFTITTSSPTNSNVFRRLYFISKGLGGIIFAITEKVMKELLRW